MKNSILLVLLLGTFISLNAQDSSIFGRDLEGVKHNKMISVFARYSPSAYVALLDIDDEIRESYDTQLIDFGVNITGAMYTRLYYSIDFYARMAKVDDSEYGDGDVNAFGGGVGFGLMHKTFFGKGDSYDIGFHAGIDIFSDIEITDHNGNKELKDPHSGNVDGFFFEPSIGITYDPFAILVGYKFVTSLSHVDGMPTITIKYFF